ncbi:2-dehydro-3-deoxygluconokinase [Staphylococcus casei]|uniref:sugar kinase n=1 Tax=Staphylococcus TaxID=1279 RepID=UPI000CD0EDB0|nr:sugar kinase [Staphylococcus casei]PNZ62774.1 2-dehydro-3-deoxygluconokinase [Staphylococcus casei]WJE86359.1 sugar kinase [Staphylococcus casei]
MSKFITIGEPIALFGADDMDKSLEDATTFTKYLAGAEVNVAVGVSRLGHSTQYITRLGNDPFGKFIAKALKKNNIGTNYIESTDDYWTAYQLKNRVSKGDPDIHYFRKGSAAAHFDKAILNTIDWKDTEHVHLSGIFPAISSEALSTFRLLIELLDQNKITSTFDPNLRPQLWDSEKQMCETINDLAKHADIILPGINEGNVLVGSDDPEVIADFYLNQSDKTSTVIVKLGKDGAYLKEKGTKSGKKIAGQKVEQVIDTVGAGDGFAVGIITGLLEKISIEEAVQRGNIIGALAVQSAGDNDGYPTKKDLDLVLKEL